ncbi:MAG: M48 family metalloprotease [Candidatus Sericytochromatia bacterium]|nr:M48 family metalloprotease [Candidatus Tanganyikabacteria bacterium]
MGNTFRTFLLLAVLSALLVLGGRAIGGQSGMVLALGLAAAMNLGSWWFSDKLALMASGAQEIGPAEVPEVYRSVSNLVQRAGMPMPRIFLIPDATPNAFATGRSPDKAVVAVTAGLINILSPDELEGVLAHELAHVRNRDTLFMAIAATMAAAITMLADMARWALIFGSGRDEDRNPLADMVMLLVAPLAALLIQMAVSRAREYEADAAAARLTGRPLSLANALLRLQQANEIRPVHAAAAHPATAHLYIVNPLGALGLLNRLFSTHPPIEQRVEKLKGLTFQAQ